MSINTQPTEREILFTCEKRLRDALPQKWRLSTRFEIMRNKSWVDAIFDVTSPSDETATFTVEAKRSFQPKALLLAVEQIQFLIDPITDLGEQPLIATDYLSARSRELLLERDINWIDTTGNMRIVSDRPGLFIESRGAQRDPWRRDKPLQTLRGKAAGRAMRALVDTRPPYGVREIALRTGTSAPTLSRVIELLEQESILERDMRGGVLGLDWPAAIRRWSEDYPGPRSNKPRLFLEPRGFDALNKKLETTSIPYAVTESFAAKSFAPVAPTQIAVVYVTDIYQAESELGLRQAEVGANVMLVEPLDSVALERTIRRDGVTMAAPSQIAVDLLTGPGREPAEGEALIEWMGRNENVWRS